MKTWEKQLLTTRAKRRVGEADPRPGLMNGAESLVNVISQHQAGAKQSMNEIVSLKTRLLAMEKQAQGLPGTKRQIGEAFRAVMQAAKAFQDAYHAIDKAVDELKLVAVDARQGR